VLLNICPWPLAGVLVGLLAVGLQWVDNLPLGATGSAAGFVDWVRGRGAGSPSWRALFFVGTLAGGLVYAVVSHRWSLGWAYPGFGSNVGGGFAAKAALLIAAGAFIGFGARWAGGCTSGHGICGVGRLQAGSVVATATFVVTAVVVAHLVWGRAVP
jgi:uncharacterized protein